MADDYSNAFGFNPRRGISPMPRPTAESAPGVFPRRDPVIAQCLSTIMGEWDAQLAIYMAERNSRQNSSSNPVSSRSNPIQDFVSPVPPPTHDVIINLDNNDFNFDFDVQEYEAPTANINNAAPVEDNPPNAEAVHNVLEAQQSLKFLLKYLPFCLILLSKAIYDHCEGIFNLIILCATFLYANSVVKREATAQVRRSFSKLIITMLYIWACFAFIAFVFEDEKFYLNLLLIPPYKQPSTVWDLLWMTGLTDFILKLITVLFKIVLTILPVWIIPFKKRGKVYLFIESTSQFYRSLAPIQPWLFFLLESYHGAEKMIGVFLSAAYMISKGTDLMAKWKLFKASAIKLLQNMAVGTTPTKDQVSKTTNNCPICHDEYDSPVLLHCKHIFCENCVSTWFDREQTCPLCRAKIVDDPTWRDGSTTSFVQLF